MLTQTHVIDCYSIRSTKVIFKIIYKSLHNLFFHGIHNDPRNIILGNKLKDTGKMVLELIMAVLNKFSFLLFVSIFQFS